MVHPKNDILAGRAKSLQKEMTPQERHLWYDFLRGYPVRFRRQTVIGNYIVDFYCHQVRLVIELDGSQHFDPKGITYDKARSEYLESLGLRVIRYANNQVNEEFRAVCENIDYFVKEALRRG